MVAIRVWRRKAFCVHVNQKPDGTRDVFVRQVEPCEAQQHLSLEELRTFVVTDSLYSQHEKVKLLDQIANMRGC